MFRGFGRPPLWAVIVLVVGVAALAVLVPLAVGRGQLSQAEIEAATGPLPPADEPADAQAQPLAVQRPTDRPLRVLFAGDSITVGAFATSDDRNFRGLVTAALSAGGPVKDTRIGDSGLTTAEVLPEVAGAGDGFDLVVVELGTNDVAESTPEQFAVDYPAMLDALRQRSPDALLVCAGPWGGPNDERRRDEGIVAKACTERGGRFVGLVDLYADQANRYPETMVREDGVTVDDFHPNDAGHAAIARAILGVLAY